jgi:DMSO/TMAO reductase YedYZ molybdopterin-dependent catalytic subunit
MKKYCLLFLLSLICFFVSPILAQSVKITGEVTNPMELKPADMQQLPSSIVARKDKDGKDHAYTGVLLSVILQKAGVTLGKDLRGENLTKYVLIEAADGYQVVFALAELDKEFTDRAIILATTVDGQPLATGDGPFRIIVQDEKKPARCIKQVTGIKVLFAK